MFMCIERRKLEEERKGEAHEVGEGGGAQDMRGRQGVCPFQLTFRKCRRTKEWHFVRRSSNLCIMGCNECVSPEVCRKGVFLCSVIPSLLNNKKIEDVDFHEVSDLLEASSFDKAS